MNGERERELVRTRGTLYCTFIYVKIWVIGALGERLGYGWWVLELDWWNRGIKYVVLLPTEDCCSFLFLSVFFLYSFFSIPSCESIFIHHSVIRIPQIFLCSSHFSISILLLLLLAFCLSVYVHLIQRCCAASAACHFPIFQAGVSLVVIGGENGDTTQHTQAEKRSQILLKNVKVRVFKARLVSL